MENELNNVPTADVVPKSEFDDLQKMLDATIAAQETLQTHLANVMAEVAREIFEDIEKCMAHDYISSIGVYNGALGLRIAELKKKYTERTK